MGLQYRAIRAAASALLVAAAVGTGGMAGMTSALAADPATVGIAGTVVDGGGSPLAGVHLVISEEHPADGALAAVQAVTGADGSFGADVQAWGTAEAPAKLTIKADDELEVIGETCSWTWGVTVDDVRDVTLADAAPGPLTVTATTTLLGEVCGTTATPPPDSQSAGGRPDLTPPPTDTVPLARSAAAGREGPALSIGVAIGLLLAAVLLLPAPGARRHD